MSKLLKGSDPDPIYILRSGPQSVSSLKFVHFEDEDEEFLISGCENGLVQIWDLKTRRVKLRIETCGTKSVLFADIIELKGEKFIVSHSRNGCIQFWYIINDEVELRKTLSVYEYGYCPIAIHKEGDKYWLAYPSSGDSEFSLTNIDMSYENEVFCMKTNEKRGIVMHIKLFSRDNLLLSLIGYEDGHVCLWDLSKCVLIYSKKIHNDPVMCLDVDDHSSKLISGSADNSLYVLLIDDDLKLQSSISHCSKTSGFACVSIRKDGKIVVCGGWDGSIRVFGWKRLKPLAILKYHCKVINSIAFSRRNLIAAASKDGTISLWNVYKDA